MRRKICLERGLRCRFCMELRVSVYLGWCWTWIHLGPSSNSWPTGYWHLKESELLGNLDSHSLNASNHVQSLCPQKCFSPTSVHTEVLLPVENHWGNSWGVFGVLNFWCHGGKGNRKPMQNSTKDRNAVHSAWDHRDRNNSTGHFHQPGTLVAFILRQKDCLIPV